MEGGGRVGARGCRGVSEQGEGGCDGGREGGRTRGREGESKGRERESDDARQAGRERQWRKGGSRKGGLM